jgi:hypothetical protein
MVVSSSWRAMRGWSSCSATPSPKFGSIDQSETRQVSYHIGFIIENRDDVEALHRNMAAGGIDLEAPREMRGGWLFYCYAPGHVLVEVGARSLLQ